MLGKLIGSAKRVARARVGPWVARRQPVRVDLPSHTWGLSTGSDGHLRRADVDLVELTHRWGSPLHVIDARHLDAVVDEALGSDDPTPTAQIFYSYKTNPIPGVLSRLHRRGVGAEVISPFELWLAMRLGVTPDRIIYNGPCKSSESLRIAIDNEVLLINANSAGDLEAIRDAATAAGRIANVGLRVSLPTMWQGQFGIRSDHSVEMLRTMLDQPRFRVVGLHFHNGFTLRSHDQFEQFVQAALDHCAHIHAATGWLPTILDLGGSLACPTVVGISPRQHRLNRALATDLIPPDPRQAIRIGDASRLAAAAANRRFAELGGAPPTVVLEPGRALTASAQMLLTTVHDVKLDGDIPFAVLDAGINVAETATTEYHQLFSATAPSVAPTTSYRLAGPICSPADVLYNNWRLPELEPGHVLAIMDSGAYFVPFSTSFSFPRPPIVVLEQGDVTLLRRAETFDDIVALDQLGEPGAA